MCTVVISEISENDDAAGESSVCASNLGNKQSTKKFKRTKNAQGAVNDTREGNNYENLKIKNKNKIIKNEK